MSGSVAAGSLYGLLAEINERGGDCSSYYYVSVLAYGLDWLGELTFGRNEVAYTSANYEPGSGLGEVDIRGYDNYPLCKRDSF